MNPAELLAIQRGALIMYHLMRCDSMHVSEIAVLIGLSNRQTYRVMNQLSECNIPIYPDRGVWKVLKDWEDQQM